MKRITWKTALFFLFSIALGLFVLFLPSILSRSPLKKFAISLVDQAIPGSLEVGAVHLSWWGPQEMHEVFLSDPEGNPVLEVRSWKTDLSLVRLLWNRSLVGSDSEFISLKGAFYEVAPGVSNLERAVRIDLYQQTKNVSQLAEEQRQKIEVDGTFSLSRQGQWEQFSIVGKTTEKGKEAQFNAKWKDETLLAEANEFPTTLVDQWLVLANPELRGVATTLLGKTFTLSVESTQKREGHLLLYSPLCSAELKGEISNQLIHLQSSSYLRYTLTPSAFSFLTRHLSKVHAPRLLRDTLLEFDISEAEIPLSFSWKEIDLKTKGSFDKLELAWKHSSLLFTSFKGEITFLGREKKVLELKGDAYQNKEPLSFVLEAPIPKSTEDLWAHLFKEGGVELKVEGFSALWLEPFLKHKIPPILDKRFSAILHSEEGKRGVRWAAQFSSPERDLSAKAYYDPAQQAFIGSVHKGSVEVPWKAQVIDQRLELTVESAPLNVHAALHIDGALSLYRSDDPVLIECVLTPALMRAFSDSWQLLEPAHASIVIHSFKLPKEGNQWKLGDLSLHGNLTIDQYKARETQTLGEIDWEQVHVQFDTKKLYKSFDLSMKALRKQEQQKIVAHLENLPALWGKSDLKDLVMDLEVQVNELPFSLLCQTFLANTSLCQPLGSLIGDRVNSKMDIHVKNLNGPLQLAVEGTRGSFQAFGALSKGGVVLQKPLIATLQLTKQSVETLTNLFPFLDGLQEAEEEWEIRLSPEGFFFPIHDYHAANIRIDHGELYMGRNYFGSKGAIYSLLKALKSKEEWQRFQVWFTPLYFQVNQGVLGLHRMDLLLAERYPIALWGNIDFIRDRVHLILGLRGEALKRAFGIKGVKKDEMLQVPLKGTLSQAKVDQKKLVKQLTQLTIESKGIQGKVLGTLLTVLNGQGKKMPPPPAPTTNPIPWDAQKETEKSSTKNPLKKAGKSVNKLLEAVGL